jgi:hypothetical protein
LELRQHPDDAAPFAAEPDLPLVLAAREPARSGPHRLFLP